MTSGLAMIFRQESHNLRKNELISWSLLKLKISALEKTVRENERTSHRWRENICKRCI